MKEKLESFVAKEKERLEAERKREEERQEKQAEKERKETGKSEKRKKEEKERLEKKQKREKEEKGRLEKKEKRNKVKRKQEEEQNAKSKEKRKRNKGNRNQDGEQTRKKQKVKQSFAASFSTKTANSTPKGMSLAPVTRKQSSAENIQLLDERLTHQECDNLYLKELETRKPILKYTKGRLSTIDDNSSSSIEIVGKKKSKAGLRNKLLQFHTNHRPAYYGTWRKSSQHLSPKNPFKRDTDLFDYDVDSDEEWEEEEPGESLSNSEGEDEDVDKDEDFVPHLSDDERVEKEEIDDDSSEDGDKVTQIQEMSVPVSSRMVKRKRKRRGTESTEECTVCKKSFKYKSDLLRHERGVHSDEKPFKCDECGQCFGWARSLQTHNRIHSGEKPFKCEHCDKCYSQAGVLQRHKRIHSGEKPFKCTQCERCYSDSSALQSHKRTHSGEEPSHQVTEFVIEFITLL